MSMETLKNDLNKNSDVKKININVLKNRVFERHKKEKFQNKIIVGSVLISIGLLSYFSG